MISVSSRPVKRKLAVYLKCLRRMSGDIYVISQEKMVSISPGEAYHAGAGVL